MNGDDRYVALQPVGLKNSATDRATDPGSYGRAWADDYDDAQGDDEETTAAAVAAIARLVGPNASVLEVAAGTGRVAVPLAAFVGHVTASDASPEMLQRTAERPGSSAVDIRLDVLPALADDGRYDLVFVLANSLWMLTSVESQRQAIVAMASRVSPGGLLLIENTEFNHERAEVFEILPSGREQTRRTTIDPHSRTLRHRYTTGRGRDARVRDVDVLPMQADEIVAMAAAAGFALISAWADWLEKPPASEDRHKIMVFAAAV